jgi:hypothetical protein
LLVSADSIGDNAEALPSGGGGYTGDGHLWCDGWDRQGDCAYDHVDNDRLINMQAAFNADLDREGSLHIAAAISSRFDRRGDSPLCYLCLSLSACVSARLNSGVILDVPIELVCLLNRLRESSKPLTPLSCQPGQLFLFFTGLEAALIRVVITKRI